MTGARASGKLALVLDEIIDVAEEDHFGSPLSHLSVFVAEAALVTLLLFCIREIIRARRLARQAKDSVVPGAPLLDGPRIVSGTVALAQGEKAAVRVTIKQEGSEQRQKSGYSHTWQETRRETTARPFYLVHESGARIRVEPPEDVSLVDKLDQKEFLIPAVRRIRAELVPGERAIVEGVLRRDNDPEAEAENAGYREGASRGWVLSRGPKGMFISTEGLERRHLLRALAFLKTIPIVLLIGAGAQIPIYDYLMRVFQGQDVAVDYGGKTSQQTYSSKRGTRTRYYARAIYPDGRGEAHLELFEVDEDDYNELPLAAGGRIWVRSVPKDPSATALGRGCSVNGFAWLISLLILGVGMWRVGVAHYHRRWYEGYASETRRGRLPAPTGERFGKD